MDASSFNLDCDRYQDIELESLLQLKAPYGPADLLLAKRTLSKQLSSKPSANVGELQFFVDTITQRLANKLRQPGPPTTVSFATTTTSNTVQQHGSNFLIENPDRPAGLQASVTQGRITTGSGQAPPGHLNPLNVRTIMQAICIDSRFRPNYYTTKSTNFDVTLPSMQKNVVSMRVSSIELPTTYYAVSAANQNNTCLIIDAAFPYPAPCWLLTLPDGNYEQSWANNSQAAFIELAMNAAIVVAQPGTVDLAGSVTLTPLSPPLSDTVDLSLTLDRVNGKAVFGLPPLSSTSRFSPSGFTLRFNVDSNGNPRADQALQLRLGWQLGYRAPEYVALLLCPSEGICLVCGPRYGFVSIDDYQKNTGPSYIVAYANSVLQDNIITRINLAELQADVGVYQSSSDPGLSNQLNRTREYFGPVDIQRLHIALYDEFGRIIDLNYMDWSLTLAFEVLYN